MPDHRVRDVRILQGSNLVVGEVQVDGSDCTDRVSGGGSGRCGARAPAASIVCRSAHYHPAPDVSDWKVPS